MLKRVTDRAVQSYLLIKLALGIPGSAAADEKGFPKLRAGAAAVAITPFGDHPDWDGTVTSSGVWGEVFPEVFYGTGRHRRRDCPAADTDRPAEPPVGDRMSARYRFVFGLCPDQLGYIVPGYDFRAPEKNPGSGGLRRAADPCRSAGVPDHYHETQSAGSRLAPLWACAVSALLEGRPPAEPACREEAP